MTVTVTRTYDPDIVTGVMLQPEIWKTCVEGDQDVEFTPDMNEYWLVVTNYNQIAGLYNLHPHNSVTLEIHAQILPEFRQECARESARKVLQWVLDYSPAEYQKVIAQIPVIYPNVIAFTENAGFQNEGLNRKSYRKHGEIHDQVLLGITRDEIKSFLRGPQ